MLINLEKTIEKCLVDEVKKQGGLALKLVSPGMNGLPDRLILMPNGKWHLWKSKHQARNPDHYKSQDMKSYVNLALRFMFLMMLRRLEE